MMGSLSRVEWFWHRLCTVSVQELAVRARDQARRSLLGARQPTLVPPARMQGRGACWLPLMPMEENRLVLQRAREVLEGRWRDLTDQPLLLGFPPNWNRHPRTGVVFPLLRGRASVPREGAQEGDVRQLWLLNRHRELVVLAQAWYVSGEEIFLEGCASLLQTWFVQCPHPLGPNWVSSTELAARLLNWALAWQLLGGHRSPLFDGAAGALLRSDWLDQIWRHAEFIRAHRSRRSTATSHLVSELAGLFVAGVTWAGWRESRLWREQARAQLESELPRICTPDGVVLEQSVPLQQQLWDALVLAGLAARSCQRDFSPEFWQRLEAMLDYLAALMDAGGQVPQWGGGDNRPLLGLDLTSGVCPYHSRLATGALLFGRADLARKAGAVDRRSRWLLGDERCQGFDNLLLRAEQATRNTDFPAGGVYVLGACLDSSDEIRVVLDAGPLGGPGLASYAHADALAFTLSVGGRPFLVDPGVGSLHQAALRDGFRGTAMHNTLCVEGKDQAVVAGRFLWSRRYACRVLERRANLAQEQLIAEHDGYRHLPGHPLHRRSWSLNRQARLLTVRDQLMGSRGHEVKLHWHFSEHCTVTCTPEGLRVFNGPVVVDVLLPLDGEITILHGSETPLGGWVSPRSEEWVVSTTVCWKGRLEPEMALETVFRCPSGPSV